MGPGTVHTACGGRMIRTIRDGRPAVVCRKCGYTRHAGTMVERGARVPVPWDQTEKEVNQK